MTDKPQLPASGGSWVRQPDGTLLSGAEFARKQSTKPDAPVSTARKPTKKER